MIIPKIFTRFFGLALLAFLLACQSDVATQAQPEQPNGFSPPTAKPKLDRIENEAIKKVLESAVEQTTLTKTYDSAYVVLKYPMGDVPIEKGVCTDVVIRAFRKAGVDLQKTVHEDMSANFKVYPKKWGLKKADSNIDHRRVPNLQTFFTRQGKSLQITEKSENYKPGDVVAWDLDGKGLTHIGLVSNIWSESSKRYLIIHNIGGGTQAEDRLFDWKVIGHYRYF
jgi:uncharacterized protein YijF (DUF1287 family)